MGCLQELVHFKQIPQFLTLKRSTSLQNYYDIFTTLFAITVLGMALQHFSSFQSIVDE
jgi:hypothetical protein